MNAKSSVTALHPAPRNGASAVSSSTDLPSLFKALGDPLRLQIMLALKDDSLSVSELCEVFQLRQSALSHHLKVLVQSGLLARRREGTAIFYRRQLPDGPHEELLQTLLASIDNVPPAAGLNAGLARVYTRREQNSLEFFRDNSSRFKQQRELIASWQDYTQAVLHILDRCTLPPNAHVLEIGPGDGSLLPALAERAAFVTAIDNSQAMLDTAIASNGHLENVYFIHGDTTALPRQSTRFDAAVANMVLHHTPHPEQVLGEAADALNPGGFLIISDLCAHDQAWAREHCGDLWLGFEPAQLTTWAADAGLTDCAEIFIAQRNGFQIQVRLFQRPKGHQDRHSAPNKTQQPNSVTQTPASGKRA